MQENIFRLNDRLESEWNSCKLLVTVSLDIQCFSSISRLMQTLRRVQHISAHQLAITI